MVAVAVETVAAEIMLVIVILAMSSSIVITGVMVTRQGAAYILETWLGRLGVRVLPAFLSRCINKLKLGENEGFI